MDRKKGQLGTICRGFVCLMICVLMLAYSALGAEDPAKFPSKEITIIMPWPAGGTGDVTSRKLGELAGKILGQPIVVVFKTGATGVIGLTAVAKAAPDGYTIGNFVASPLIYVPQLKSVPYNVREDFTWIMQYLRLIMLFCVRSDSPWRNFDDLIEEARKNPGKLNYATAGPLGSQHILCEYLFSLRKVKLNHVPVAGAKEVETQLLGGHIHAAFSSETVHQVRTGKFRALAAQSNERFREFPDVPTFSEIIGHKVETSNFMGYLAPKGLDPRVHKKLLDAFKKAYEDPSFQELLKNLGVEPVFLGPEPLKEMILKDFDEKGKILKDLGFIK